MSKLSERPIPGGWQGKLNKKLNDLELNTSIRIDTKALDCLSSDAFRFGVECAEELLANTPKNTQIKELFDRVEQLKLQLATQKTINALQARILAATPDPDVAKDDEINRLNVELGGLQRALDQARASEGFVAMRTQAAKSDEPKKVSEQPIPGHWIRRVRKIMRDRSLSPDDTSCVIFRLGMERMEEIAANSEWSPSGFPKCPDPPKPPKPKTKTHEQVMQQLMDILNGGFQTQTLSLGETEDWPDGKLAELENDGILTAMADGYCWVICQIDRMGHRWLAEKVGKKSEIMQQFEYLGGYYVQINNRLIDIKKAIEGLKPTNPFGI